MEKEEIIKLIKAKTNKSEEEITKLAKEKKDKLGDMITENGSYTLVASDLNVSLKHTDDVDIEVEDENILSPVNQGGREEIRPDSLISNNYIKNPEVGKSLTLYVDKIVRNPNTKGKNKETGEEFVIGLKKKDGTAVRVDIETKEGIYTINSWEVYSKLFFNNPDGKSLKDFKNRPSWQGLKIELTKNYHGNYAMRDAKEISKLMDTDVKAAEEYKKKCANAIKESKLYTVKIFE